MVVPDKKTKAQIQDDRLNGHWDKIEALEKNIKSMVETDTSNQDRIISLEKKLEDLEDMQKTIVKTDPVRMNKEIAELRELLHGHHLELDKIAELKEHTSDLQRQANHNAIETNTREVILTEVLQIIIDDFYIGISWEGGKKELLEKLDPPKGEVDIANMVLKRCPYCTELFSVDANTLEIRGSLKEDRLSGGTDDKTEKKEDSDAKQVEKLLNNMGCDVKVASVEWSENLIKGSREKKMTDDEIMLFNEELMAKIHKREVQPLEVSGGSKSLSTPQTSVERRVIGEGKEASNDNEEKLPELSFLNCKRREIRCESDIEFRTMCLKTNRNCFKPKEKTENDYVTKLKKGQATTGTKEVLYPGIYGYILDEPEKDFTIQYYSHIKACRIKFNDGREYPIGSDVYRAITYHIGERVRDATRKELIEDLEKEWDFLYNKICREYFTLLKERNPDIKPVFEMIDFYINSRRKKWRGKLKQ